MKVRQLLRSRSVLATAAAALFMSLIGFTCIGHEPYRVNDGHDTMKPVLTSIERLQEGDDRHRALVEKSATELHGGQFALHFIEFDDHGWLWNREQTDKILEAIRVAAAPRGAVILTYAHGWKHSASVCDTNVACFRDVLRYLAEAERAVYGDKRREIIGVYLGWRGGITPLPVLKELTFWNRKEAAHTIGNGEAIEVLSRLNVLYKDLALEGSRHAARSRLVTVGHSMGGAIVYSAIAGAMKDRVVAQMPSDTSRDFAAPIDGFGDLVVLVNPAFEASIYRSIADRSIPAKFSPKQTPLLITVGSVTDRANQLAFPIGRTIGTLFQSIRDDSQREATRTSLANYDRYVTHELEALGKGMVDTPPKGGTCACPTPLPRWADRKKGVPSCGVASDYGNMHFAAGGCFGAARLIRDADVHPDNPFMVIRAENDVVAEHNGIFNPTFTDFLVSFVAATERKKSAVYGAASSLATTASTVGNSLPFDPGAAVRNVDERIHSAYFDRVVPSDVRPPVATASAPDPVTATVADTEALRRVIAGRSPAFASRARATAPPHTDGPTMSSQSGLPATGSNGAASASAVVEAGDDTFDALVLGGAKPAFVAFVAPWCGPCRMIDPIIRETGASLGTRAGFFVVNVDEHPKIAARYGVTTLPTVMMFREGKLVDRAVGAMPRDLLERFVERNLVATP